MLIQTPRLALRDFVSTDAGAVHNYHSHPSYPWHFYESASPTHEESQRFVQRFLDQQGQKPRTFFQLAITLPTGELIGNCGVRQRNPAVDEADVGYELSPSHWGNGYATEAAAAMIAFGFRSLLIKRITARCLSENTASSKVLRRLGMVRVEIRRNAEYFKGRSWDEDVYALAVTEWNQVSR
jgi:ribosomal-protein-alanine N-acetyltransferase